jgi:hypothetical protein
METIFEIALRVSTPLALAGFFAAAFFLVARQVIARSIFPTLTKHLSAGLIKVIIDRLFILSLVAMILGFAGFALTAFMERPAQEQSDDGRVSLEQVVISRGDDGRFIEALVSNTSPGDVVLSKFVYSRGVSSAEMAAIPICCPYCMEAWYAVQHGPVDISTPGSRLEQAVWFVRSGDENRTYRGRLHYAPGCHVCVP